MTRLLNKPGSVGIAVMAALGALCLPGEAQAWSSMRCGNELVSKGDSMYEVQATCGEPDQVVQYVEYRTVRVYVGDDCRTDSDGHRTCTRIYRERTIEIPMHRLTYDFGKNRFIHHLTFERGSLRGIETGSYGKKPPQGG